MADFAYAPLEAPAGARAPVALEAVLERAHAEADAVREAARAEGYTAGRAEALAAVVPAAAAFAEAVVAAHEHAANAAERLEHDAVDLAFAVAEKVLSARVEVDPGVVLEAVRGALRGITDRERVTVSVNPEDLDLVRAASEELRAALGGIEHCEIQADRRVGSGGALVRYADGLVDASIEIKLERAREAVREHLAT